MVTAELAVAIPAVVLVLAMCLAGVTAGIDQIRCVDAARVAARSAARGDTPGRCERSPWQRPGRVHRRGGRGRRAT